MSNIKQFFDKDGNDIFPVTHVSAVFDIEGNSLEEKLINYPILDWEEDKVVDVNYQYGDIRRYGAKCDGETDDSAALQTALDICGPNNEIVILPNKRTRIEQPIILQENANIGWKYSITGKGESVGECGIFQATPILFVGCNFYNDVPKFTRVSIAFNNVNISATESLKCVCFKAVTLYSSKVIGCKFYKHYVLLEGAITTGSVFKENRVQGFRYAFMTSTSIYNDEYNHDIISEMSLASDFDITELDAMLVIFDDSKSNNQRYVVQCTDGWFKNNYLAGSSSMSTYPRAVFVVDSFDIDFIIDENWFEYCKYVVSRNIRENTTTVSGTSFINNAFQYFHRIFDPRGRYAKFRIQDCTFSSFSKTQLAKIFTKAEDDDINNYISGILVGIVTEEYRPYMTSITFKDNYVTTCDYSIYVDNGNNFASFRFSCNEDGNVYENITNPPYIRLRSNKDIFDVSYFKSFDNIALENATKLIDKSAYINTFKGQVVYIDNLPYKVIWDTDNAVPKILGVNNQIILTSPDGSKWQQTIDDSGNSSWAKIE